MKQIVISKRVSSIIIAVSVCVGAILGIFLFWKNDNHTHSYEKLWTKDGAYHWHICEVGDCDSVSDKAEHTWDELNYCTVCFAVKGEDAWLASLQPNNFKNVTVRLYGEFSEEGEFDELVKLDNATGEGNQYVTTILGALEDFSDFVYNSQSNVYESDTEIFYTVTVEGITAQITAENVVVKIDANNKITEISCDMTQSFDGDAFELTVTFEFSDYGTTVIA